MGARAAAALTAALSVASLAGSAHGQAPAFRVKDIHPGAGAASSEPKYLHSVGDITYFVATTSALGSELYRSDATAEGTTLVRDISPGTRGSSIDKLLSAGGVLYFVADDGVHGLDVWRSDGTEQGTRIVADLQPVAGGGAQHQAGALEQLEALARPR